jgi:hypothetical protein
MPSRRDIADCCRDRSSCCLDPSYVPYLTTVNIGRKKTTRRSARGGEVTSDSMNSQGANNCEQLPGEQWVTVSATEPRTDGWRSTRLICDAPAINPRQSLAAALPENGSISGPPHSVIRHSGFSDAGSAHHPLLCLRVHLVFVWVQLVAIDHKIHLEGLVQDHRIAVGVGLRLVIGVFY